MVRSTVRSWSTSIGLQSIHDNGIDWIEKIRCTIICTRDGTNPSLYTMLQIDRNRIIIALSAGIEWELIFKNGLGENYIDRDSWCYLMSTWSRRVESPFAKLHRSPSRIHLSTERGPAGKATRSLPSNPWWTCGAHTM
jgi:hypothetical protein